MANLDDKVREYMEGWTTAASTTDPGFDDPAAHRLGDYGRGYANGRKARALANLTERERLAGVCEFCHGEGHRDWAPCHPCGGSGSSPTVRVGK
jgi:hypothetical protein